VEPTPPFARLPRSFYLRPTLRVAADLLGCFLVRRSGRSFQAGRIVEVEAYLGSRDPASHAYRGKTRRNEVMFREGGHLYVYFTYGMHYCANVVTGEEGTGHAVLLRAVEPVLGMRGMLRRRRVFNQGVTERHLTDGPARLCQAMRIGAKQNGTDLCGDSVFIASDPGRDPRLAIGRSPRIGISSGIEHRWRFFIRGNRWVSR
jgi:DNA-3-methyladenine glycosylase